MDVQSEITRRRLIDKSISVLQDEMKSIQGIVFGNNRFPFIYNMIRIRTSFTICFIRIDLLLYNNTDKSILNQILHISSDIRLLEEYILLRNPRRNALEDIVYLRDKNYGTFHKKVQDTFDRFWLLIKDLSTTHREMNSSSLLSTIS